MLASRACFTQDHAFTVKIIGCSIIYVFSTLKKCLTVVDSPLITNTSVSASEKSSSGKSKPVVFISMKLSLGGPRIYIVNCKFSSIVTEESFNSDVIPKSLQREFSSDEITHGTEFAKNAKYAGLDHK